MYGIFKKPVSAVESTVYITAIFKHYALRILHRYLPLYREADRRDMLAQVRWAAHESQSNHGGRSREHTVIMCGFSIQSHLTVQTTTASCSTHTHAGEHSPVFSNLAPQS